MSIPDNPFQPDSPTPHQLHLDSPPTLHLQPPASTSPDSHNPTPPSDVPTPGMGLAPPAAGTKTPRRVQWNTESPHIVAMPMDDGGPASPAHTLDEHNIDQVRDALQRHQSLRDQRPRSMLSVGSVGGSVDEEDYDYRLDTGPPLEPETSHLDDNEHPEVFDNEMHDHVPVYIDPGERDGLPTLPQQEGNEQLEQARDMVAGHTGKWGLLRKRVRTAQVIKGALAKKGEGKTETVEPEKEPTHDGLTGFGSNFATPPPGMQLPGGTSVLSSLLALYNQQEINSATTTPASSRPPSIAASEEDESLTRTPDKPTHHHRRSWMSGRKSTDDGDAGSYATHHRSKSSTSLADRHLHNQNSPSFLGAVKRAKDHFTDSDRPKAARNGAGVIGALIQGTGHLYGAAAPTASTLVPAAGRPGYTLSRYSLPDVNQMPSADDTPWDSGAPSVSLSRPTSMHSSTAVEDDSPRSKETLITGAGAPAYEKKKPKGMSLKSLEALPGQARKLPGMAFRDGTHAIKSAEKWITSGGRTPAGGITPDREKGGADYFSRPMTEDERRRKEWELEKKRRKKAKEARKKQEIFIIQHVAAILARQQFLLKLARALMMFGSPSHRLETQIQATAKVLQLNCQVVYLPGTMLISFGDDTTHTSETKFLKQATGLDLGKLLSTHDLYWNVVHDRMSVDGASKLLDVLMTTPVYYNWWQGLVIGAFCSAFIVIIAFYGSFIDALMSMPLGALLVGVQMLAARNDMFGNVFEIAIATLISFLAAALASTRYFCYTALVSGGVVLILPGYIVLCGALELASRNITAGAVRIGYSVIYSLFLGFGISIGAEMYTKITGLEVSNSADYTCGLTHQSDIWYRSTPSAYWYFLACPGYSLFLSLRNQQPLWARELPVMILVSCAGWTCNHFSALAFPNRSDMTSAIGSFAVGVLGNLYGRFSNGASFPVTVTGILFQLPSGLANGGIFNFVSDATSGNANAYSDGFSVAEQLVSVAIGLTVGLFVSAVVTHPFGGGRRRGSGIFSF
ncbi:hypothetical protein P7C73_g572, partial [Tremellales sp. Uapishka_1]